MRAGCPSSCSSYCPVSLSPPLAGVVRRVKRIGARGLVKVLFPSGSSVGSVGVGRRCRGRGSRSFLFPLSGAVGSRPSCRRVRPVRPCPPVVGVAYRRGLSVRVPWFGVAVGRGVGRCRSCGGVGCSRVAPVRLSAVSRSVACPSCRGCPRPPCGGRRRGVRGSPLFYRRTYCTMPRRACQPPYFTFFSRSLSARVSYNRKKAPFRVGFLSIKTDSRPVSVPYYGQLSKRYNEQPTAKSPDNTGF